MVDDAVRFAWSECATNGSDYILAVGYADADGKAKITLLEAHTPPFNAALVIKGFADVLRAKGIDRVMGDRHSSHYAKEQFAKNCITYEFCELVRPDLKREFIALMNAKRVIVPQMTRDPEVRKQVQSLVLKKTHGGPDDRIAAIAGVCLQAFGKCAPVRVMPDYI